MLSIQYYCPVSKEALNPVDSGLTGASGVHYNYINVNGTNPIPVFIDENEVAGTDKLSQAMYKKDDAEIFYENFLAWLFATFKQDEPSFRKSLINKLNLQEGNRVLVTGCGLGDDLKYIMPQIGAAGELFAQDISDLMVVATARRFSGANELPFGANNLYLSVSNASMLPYANGYFDAAFHFGGINLFSDIKSAIHEMARVVKVGGRVVIGDEGIAPWLKGSEYGNMVVCNNKLWESDAPLSMLPLTASDVHLTWVLGNCFYIIDFEVASSMPIIDCDVLHKGGRGGSMRKRYYGQLEGVNPELKAKVDRAAFNVGISKSDWLENAISDALMRGS